MKSLFSSVSDAIEAIACGEMVIVCDDADRENEGALTMALEFVTPEDVNYMATHGRGFICLPIGPEIIDRLEIPDMVRYNNCRMGTAFTVPVDAAAGITIGVYAADRARTIQAAVDPTSVPADLVTPGHVFPLRARPRGVFVRVGHTEAAVDLARLARLKSASVI